MRRRTLRAFGGKWIITLDDQTAAGIESGDSAAMETWKGLIESVGFFATHKDWPDYAGLLWWAFYPVFPATTRQ